MIILLGPLGCIRAAGANGPQEGTGIGDPRAHKPSDREPAGHG
jgi:hypothetical protein